tara:strand:+ start:1726 stop:1929 length:204 start_codon:yes stop_codon:yes gene_type:complete
MDLEFVKTLEHAGPLTLAALILVVGMRLGKVWTKVEELLAGTRDLDERLASIEQRIAALESRHGDSS